MKNYILTIVSILLFSSFTFAASFVVNNNGDTNDANLSDNLCSDSSGNCTLRAAVQQANASASDDIVTFSAGLQTITFTFEAEIPIENAGTLQINGPGANVLTINGGTGNNRIFNTNAAIVTIADLTLTDGGINSYFGGGPSPQNGGAILVNGGSVTIQRLNVNGNYAGSGGGPSVVFGAGGGIYFNGGTHIVQDSTFANNRATSGGGGISNSGANLTIVNCTISDNSGVYQGGGLYNAGNLILRNTTIANNIAYKAGGFYGTGYGGGIAQTSGTLEINNTIVTGNTVQVGLNAPPGPPEILFNEGTITSTGNNFIGDSTGDSTNTGQPIAYQPSDIRDISPMLAPLGNYGGTTPTRALQPGSPAINAGNNNNAPSTDQRGAPRVGAVDIGSYEFGGLLFSISGRVTSDGTTGLGGVTVTLSGSSSASVVTNANGEYTFAGLAEGGNYTVTPSLANYTFSRLNASFNNLVGNQVANFRPQCVYSIDPTSASVPATSSSGTVNVTASAGCTWTATSNAPFITVTSGMGTGNGTVTYTVAANTGPVRTGTITIAGQTFTITQAALPTLSINNVSLFEGNSGTTAFVFTVTLTAASSQTVTVNYATVNGTATPPTDYQATSGTLSFAPGETSKTITILVNGDTTFEPNETFTVTLSGASNATIATATGTGTIRNDDGTGARTPFDFDGDGRSDVAVFRPSSGYWYILRSLDNSFQAVRFGQQNDQIAPGDYDGDGKADIAVFRGTVPGAGNFSYFYITNSSDNSFLAVQFGATGDVPVTGDWDGDGKSDLAVYRDGSSTGGQSYFFYRPSGSPGVNFRSIAWGGAGDKPLVGDFDGDGRLDAAVFRAAATTWFILKSSNNQVIQTNFGLSSDIPTPADFDGDGVTNIAVFRPSSGTWFTSTNPQINYGAVQFGANGDLPVPADYDGDGKADVAVFRPSTGAWYMLRSTQGFTGVSFGSSEDKPIPNAFIR